LDAGGGVHAYVASNRRGGGNLKFFLAIVASMLLATVAWAGAPAKEKSGHAYGKDGRQILDLYVPDGRQPAPLILFIHGGGWSAGSKEMGEGGQAAYFTANGYAWAALNYRLVPAVTVEEQAADVAQAIAWLGRQASRLNLDMSRVVLTGHSSGAQLAGLIATDPHWLATAGVPFASIRGVVSLDGAGIDVPGIMAAGAATSPFYANAFGADVRRQTRLSPFAHLGRQDVRRWLFIYDEALNPMAGYFAGRFAEIGRHYGLEVDLMAATDTSHMKLLSDLGTRDDSVTRAIDGFLKRALGERAAQ
jgi:pimeloyl-ACP methyl ester carboxylesterase